jgi:hypothetical protein
MNRSYSKHSITSKHSRNSEEHRKSIQHRKHQKEDSQQKLQDRRQALQQKLQQKIIFRVEYDGDYEGTMKNDMKHGTGIFTYTNGNRYEGNWRNNKKEGQGTLLYTDGTNYQGEWENDQFNGHGIYTFPNGEEYKGTFINGMFNGYGIYTYTNGRGIRYEGEWKNDVKDGKGKLIFPVGLYEGNWENGKIQPYGTMVKNGESFEGFFNIQDVNKKLSIPKLNGYFITTLHDGTKYTKVYIDGVYTRNINVKLGDDGIQDIPDDIPCPICYESLQTGNVFWLSGCHHAYHRHCIFQNYEIERRHKCPLDNIAINRENYFTIKRPPFGPELGLRHAGRRSKKRTNVM